MTSYRVVAPVFLGRFQAQDGVLFRGWSPRRYGPAYTYDLVIEAEDDQHPAMNVEYMDFTRRVMDAIRNEERGQEKGQAERGQEEKRCPLVDTSTDYHCAVPIEERGEEGFIVTFQDAPFSPVFFVREDAVLYQGYLREELGEAYPFFIHTFRHQLI